jgi:hypothetical protein
MDLKGPVPVRSTVRRNAGRAESNGVLKCGWSGSGWGPRCGITETKKTVAEP